MAQPLEPWAWWIKVREVPGAPDAIVLDRAGLWGEWNSPSDPRVLKVVVSLYDDDMRTWGWQKCFCSPLEPEIVNDRCPAHAAVCI